ncbi:MAG TPA: SpoIIE family protein phosphatase [Candidatus Limnocylindrales bacterium]
MKEDWPARVKRLEDEVAGLRRAMHTRGLIEQAKGMLAERLGCDPESAFSILSARSQETNTPLVRLAADLVAALPTSPPAPPPPRAKAPPATSPSPAASLPPGSQAASPSPASPRPGPPPAASPSPASPLPGPPPAASPSPASPLPGSQAASSRGASPGALKRSPTQPPAPPLAPAPDRTGATPTSPAPAGSAPSDPASPDSAPAGPATPGSAPAGTGTTAPAEADATAPAGTDATAPAGAGETAIGLASRVRAPELRTITWLDRRRKAPGLSMSANRTLRMAIAAMDAASDAGELAKAMATTGLKEHPDAGAAIFVAEPDGALRMLACHGWPAQAVSDWRRVPSSINTAIAHAVRTGAPVVLDGMSPHEFVLIGPGEVRVVFPLAVEDRVVGAIQFAWPVARRIGEAMKVYLAHLAAAAGRVLNNLWPEVSAGDAAAMTADLDWIRAVLDGIHGNAYLLTPLRDREGAVVDFRLEAGSAGERVPVGRRLLDVNPMLADNGVYAAYVDVLATGQTWHRPATNEETIVNGRKRRIVVSRRASRVGGAVLASWERLDEVISKDQHLVRLEAFGGFGWAEWDLNTGEGRWSPGMYRLLGREGAREASSFEWLVNAADPADKARAERLIAEVIAGNDCVVDLRVKGEGREDVRWLRLFCEAQPANVPPKTIHLLAQDISDRYAREQHLRSLQSRAAAGRLRLASQQDLTARLVDLLYPKETVTLRVPGASVHGRHFLPDTEVPLRADFCDAISLPDGSVLMLIGDMFGAGMTAAATAVRLVRPVIALGMAGTPLTRILQVVNSDLGRDEEPSLASLMLAKFAPLSGELRFASAGHLPPILLSREVKRPRLLSAPPGPVLGLIEGTEYQEFSAHLSAGDALVGYTDGVVDRRQTNPLVSLATALDGGYREAGPEGVLALKLPQSSDEACLAVLVAQD